MKSARSFACLASTLLFPLVSSAAIVTFKPDPAHPATELDYTVTASPGETINEFSIYFNPADYKNLAVVSSPSGWDSLVLQPDTAIPADGLFDSLNMGAGLKAGMTIGGFVVSFDYLGAGMPGSQAFDVVDPTTFVADSSGFTVAADASPPPEGPPPSPPGTVPEPATISLVGLALTMLMLRRRRG